MATFIFDIGKTNAKAVLLDEQGDTLWSDQCANHSLAAPPYPHVNLERLWNFLVASLRRANRSQAVTAINVSTHGACAVLLDETDALLFPVMDYEFTGLDLNPSSYRNLRPAFHDSFSPELPQGLNLGRQLHWLRGQYPEQFGRLRTLLLFPQYWVWRLCGLKLAEVTSLGCHTDLWLPARGEYSPLVDALGIRHALPPLARAIDCVASSGDALQALTGIAPGCRIFAGVHDSNASFARYLAADLEKPFTGISTGTWFVAMTSGGDWPGLDAGRDTLANVNVLGEPVPCARFMGGREFATVLAQAGGSLVQRAPGIADLQREIDQSCLALPGHAPGTGPFPRASGRIVGQPAHGRALATLYLALMIDTELALLDARGQVILGSSADKYPLLVELLAQLRPQQTFRVAGTEASTVLGAWQLTRWGEALPAALQVFQPVAPATLRGLQAYARQWRALAGA